MDDICEYHLHIKGTRRAIARFDAALNREDSHFDGIYAHYCLGGDATSRTYVGTCAGSVTCFTHRTSDTATTLAAIAARHRVHFEVFGRSFSGGFEEHLTLTNGRSDYGRKQATFVYRPDGLVEKISGGYDQWGAG